MYKEHELQILFGWLISDNIYGDFLLSPNTLCFLKDDYPMKVAHLFVDWSAGMEETSYRTHQYWAFFKNNNGNYVGRWIC